MTVRAAKPSSAPAFAGDRLAVRPDPELDLKASRFALTELGNAERWRIRHGKNFRFCDKIGWFMWDERRWRLLSEEKDMIPAEVMQTAFLTVRAITNEAALVGALGCDDPPDLGDRALDQFRAWAMLSESESWAAYERAIAKTFPSGEDGERRQECEAAVDAAAEFVRESEASDYALVTTPSRRKLWSDAIKAHGKASESLARMRSIVKTAQSFADIAITPDQLDPDRMAINVINGTLRLKRRNVKRSAEEIAAGQSQWKTDGWKIVKEPHRREDLITKLAPVKYAPSAKAPTWDSFLEQVQPDHLMRRFIHEWLGLSLTGNIGEQKLAFFYGSGRNGKGTAVEAVAHLAGDYAGSIPIESFLDNGIKRRGDQATPDLARLPGVRFLRVSEPERGARLNEGLIKMVTGGDPVDARHLNKGFFTFLPRFKMTISGNHKPEIKDTSDGIWRRLLLVPWAQTVPVEEIDRELPDKLKAEASGILNRLLEGLCDWRENGLIEPDEVRMATAAYRDQSDELGRFLAETCLIGEDTPGRPMRVGAKHLHDTYLAWCDMVGGANWSLKGFRKALIDKGFSQKNSDGVKWLGLALREGIDPEAIRDGRWSGPEATDENGAAGPNPSPDDGAPDDWEPGDDW